MSALEPSKPVVSRCSVYHLSKHAGVRSELLENARRIISNHTQCQRPTENYFTAPNAVAKIRFRDDLRLKHVERLLDSSIPIEIPVEPLDDSSPSEYELQRRERVKEFLFCCIYRQLALPVGRGMLSLRTESSLSIDIGRLRKFCFIGIEVESEKIVDLTSAEFLQKLDLKWARFHNGVAAALAHSPAFGHGKNLAYDNLHGNSIGGMRQAKRRPTVAALDDNVWLNRIISHGSPSPTPGTLAEQGGFIFGMGLNGNISRDADRVDFHDFLVRVDERMSAGTLLGLAASRIGSQDPSIIGLLAIHLDALLPEEQNSYEFVVPHNVRAVAITALGLLYQGACDRYVIERIMGEILRPAESEGESSNSSSGNSGQIASSDRESLNFCAGIALGNVLLGKMHRNASYGLGDLQITQRLLLCMRGGPLQNAQNLLSVRDKRRLGRHAGRSSKCVYEKNCVNVNVTSVGATIALGLMYLKSENSSVANTLEAPDNEHELAQTRPDFWFWRTLARHLILWNDIEPTDEWMQSNIPVFLRNASVFHVHGFSQFNQSAANACSRLDRQYKDLSLCFTSHAYMQLGALFALALKYAGSCNADADLLISKHLAIYFRYAVKECPIDSSIMQQAEPLPDLFTQNLRHSIKKMKSKTIVPSKQQVIDVPSDRPDEAASNSSIDANQASALSHTPTTSNNTNSREENSAGDDDEVMADVATDLVVSIPERAVNVEADATSSAQEVVRRFPNNPGASAAIREPTRRRGNTYRDLVEEILDARFPADVVDNGVIEEDGNSSPPAFDQRYELVSSSIEPEAVASVDEIALAESTTRALLLPPMSPTSSSPRQAALHTPQSSSSSTSPSLQRYRRTNLTDEEIADAALSSGNLDLLNELLLPSAPQLAAAGEQRATTTAPSASSSLLPTNIDDLLQLGPAASAATSPLSSFRLLATPYGIPSTTTTTAGAARSHTLPNGGGGVAFHSSTPPSNNPQQQNQTHLPSAIRTFRRSLAYCFKASRTFPSPAKSKKAPPGSCAADSYDIVNDDIQRVLAYEAYKEPFVSHCIGSANLNSLMLNCLVAKSVVMAGSGDLDTIRYCRRLFALTEPVYGNSRDEARISESTPAGHRRYGMYMAASMALGFTSLGCGRYTLSSSNAAIAALITSLSPYWPRDPNDNKHHLQMLRHMYVLAVECRMLIPRSLSAGLEFVALDCVVRNTDDTFVKLRAPILIAELPRVRQLIFECCNNGRGRTARQNTTIVFDQNDKVSWQTLCRLLNDGGEMLIEMERNQLEAQRKRLANIETVKRTPYEVSLRLRRITADTSRERITPADQKRMRVENSLMSILKQSHILELLMWMPNSWNCSVAQRMWRELFCMQAKAREHPSISTRNMPKSPLKKGVALEPRKFAYLVELYTKSCSTYKKLLERMDPFDVYWRYVYYKQRQRRLGRTRQRMMLNQSEANVTGGRDEVDGFIADEHFPSVAADDGDDFEGSDQLMLVSIKDRKEILNAMGGGETPSNKPAPAFRERKASILARRPLKRRKSSLPSILDGIVEASDDVAAAATSSEAIQEPASKRLARADHDTGKDGLPYRARHVPLQRRSSIAGVFPVASMKSTHTVRFAPDSRKTIKINSYQTPQRQSKTQSSLSPSGTKSGIRSKKLTSILKSSSNRGTYTPKSHLTMSTLASSMKRNLSNSAARQRRRMGVFAGGRSLSQTQSFASVEEEEEEELEREAVQQQRKSASAVPVDNKISQSDHAFARLRLNPLVSRVLLHDQAKVDAASLIAEGASLSNYPYNNVVDDAEIEQIRSEIPFGEAFVYEKTLHMPAINLMPTTTRGSISNVHEKSLRTSTLSSNATLKTEKLTDLIDRKLTSLYGGLSTTWAPFEFLVSASVTAKQNILSKMTPRPDEILVDNFVDAVAMSVESLQAKWQQTDVDADALLTFSHPSTSFDSPLTSSSAVCSSAEKFSMDSSSVFARSLESSSSMTDGSWCSDIMPTTTIDEEFLKQLVGCASRDGEESSETVIDFLQQKMSQIFTV